MYFFKFVLAVSVIQGKFLLFKIQIFMFIKKLESESVIRESIRNPKPYPWRISIPDLKNHENRKLTKSLKKDFIFEIVFNF